MTNIRKKTIQLSTGKRIKISGLTLAIAPSLEIGEGFTTNILGFDAHSGDDTKAPANPWGLTKDEVIEIADYNISLWMALKDRIRQYGIDNVDIFRKGV